jgi:hypothetical protein
VANDPVSPPSASAEAASAPKIQPNWRAFRHWVEKRQEKNIGARFAEADAILAEMVRREMWADDNDPPMEPAPAEPASVPAGEANGEAWNVTEITITHGSNIAPDPASVTAGEARPSDPVIATGQWMPDGPVHQIRQSDLDGLAAQLTRPVDAPRATPSESYTLAPAAEYIRHLRDCPAGADEHCTCGAVAFLRVVESTSQQLSDAVATIARIAAESADDLRAERDELRAYANAKDAELRRAYMLAEAAEKDDLRPQVQALRDRYQAMSMVMHRGVDVAFALNAILARGHAPDALSPKVAAAVEQAKDIRLVEQMNEIDRLKAEIGRLTRGAYAAR